MSSAKCQTFCPGHNVLNKITYNPYIPSLDCPTSQIMSQWFQESLKGTTAFFK